MLTEKDKALKPISLIYQLQADLCITKKSLSDILYYWRDFFIINMDNLHSLKMSLIKDLVAQSAGAIEYTDYTSSEG